MLVMLASLSSPLLYPGVAQEQTAAEWLPCSTPSPNSSPTTSACLSSLPLQLELLPPSSSPSTWQRKHEHQAMRRRSPAWFSVTRTNSVCKDKSAESKIGPKSKWLILFSRPTHGFVIPDFSSFPDPSFLLPRKSQGNEESPQTCFL